MSLQSEWYVVLFYAALIPVMIFLAFGVSWVDKRWGGGKRKSAEGSLNGLKVVTIIAVAAMFLLAMRLPSGIHIVPSPTVEQITRDFSADFAKLRETVLIGCYVVACWFSAAYGTLRVVAARSAAKSI